LINHNKDRKNFGRELLISAIAEK